MENLSSLLSSKNIWLGQILPFCQHAKLALVMRSFLKKLCIWLLDFWLLDIEVQLQQCGLSQIAMAPKLQRTFTLIYWRDKKGWMAFMLQEHCTMQLKSSKWWLVTQKKHCWFGFHIYILACDSLFCNVGFNSFPSRIQLLFQEDSTPHSYSCIFYFLQLIYSM